MEGEGPYISEDGKHRFETPIHKNIYDARGTSCALPGCLLWVLFIVFIICCLGYCGEDEISTDPAPATDSYTYPTRPLRVSNLPAHKSAPERREHLEREKQAKEAPQEDYVPVQTKRSGDFEKGMVQGYEDGYHDGESGFGINYDEGNHSADYKEGYDQGYYDGYYDRRSELN